MTSQIQTLADVLTDVTLREGSQQPIDLRAHTVEQKLELLNLIIATGLKHIEFSAFAPGEWFSDSEEMALSLAKMPSGLNFRALYFNTRGLETLLKYPHIKSEGVFHTAATSNYRTKNYRQESEEQVFTKMRELMQQFAAHKLNFDTLVISTAWGEKDEIVSRDQVLNFTRKLCDCASHEGFDIESITFADTVGNAKPDEVRALFADFKMNWPSKIVSAHLHPPSSIAEECIVAGMEGGVDQWEAAWGGVGGSPFATEPGGNLDIRYLMRIWSIRGLRHGVDTAAVQQLVSWLQQNTTRNITQIDI